MSTEQSYQIESELRVGMPRQAHLTATARACLRGLILFTLVVGGVIVWLAARDVGDLAALRTHGMVGQAVVTDKSEVHGKSISYYLSYSLQAPGIAIEDGDKSVSYSMYEMESYGAPLTLTFLPKQPQTHRLGYIDDRRVRARGVDWALGLLGWIGLMGLGLGAMAYSYASELRLLRYGMPAHGVIEWVKPPDSAKVTDYTVKYRFNVPRGEQVQTCAVPGPTGKQLAADQTITVLYDPNNVYRCYPYRALRYTELTSRT